MTNAADDCIPQLAVCRTRIASLDASGNILGGNTMYVSDALLKVDIKPNITAGDETKAKNGCGDVFVDYKAPDSLNWYDVTMEFLTPDPHLHALLLPLSSKIVSGSATGWAFPRIGSQAANGISVEFFTKRIKNGALSAVFPYAHWALPLVQNLSPGDKTLDANEQHSIVTGQAVENANWYDGPANDWPSVAAPAVAAAQWIPVATLPAVVCGPQADVAS